MSCLRVLKIAIYVYDFGGFLATMLRVKCPSPLFLH